MGESKSIEKHYFYSNIITVSLGGKEELKMYGLINNVFWIINSPLWSKELFESFVKRKKKRNTLTILIN